MLCEICHKREATVHIKEITGSQTKVWHLCEQCAKKQSIKSGDVNPLSLAAFLYQLAAKEATEMDNQSETAEESRPPKKATAPGLRCARCGLTAAEFRKIGRFGCPACYEAFQPLLEDILADLHHGLRHRGRTPADSPPLNPRDAQRRRLHLLEEELDKAVASEAYERAALLRDQIRKLRNHAPDSEGPIANDR